MVPPTPFIGENKAGKEFQNLRNTYNTEEELFDIVMKNQADWDKMAPEIVEWDEKGCEDADVILIAHGVVSRATLGAYNELRAQGKKVGYFRPITMRPFPVEAIRKAVEGKKIFVTESAYGQMLKMVENALYGMSVETHTYLRPGLGITTEEVIAEYNKIVG
jgi:2-oxoglutarate ferredoxin oxidoreductase subunit alpha